MKSLPFVCYVMVVVLCVSTPETSAQASVIALQASGATFQGTRENAGGRQYLAFRGIPYAKTIGGAKRWTDPVIREPEGTIKATAFGDKCPQWHSLANRTIGSEDCLFLNIYTPQWPSQRAGAGFQPNRNLLPVMVYIHGGGYTYGSGDTIGPKRFMRHDIVLVTFNYRLGLLGFLSTSDQTLPGNYGLLDQITALRWVRSHIRDFGGNPDMVTIFGDSAGGASVNLLMMSPRATTLKLFHRAIIMSGSALCDWAVEPNPREYAEEVGESLQCSTGSSEDIKDCLNEKTPDELVRAVQDTVKTWSFPIRTAPVVDSESRDSPVLPDEPKTLMTAGGYAQIPVMTGIDHDEGLMGYTAVHLQHGNDNFRDKEYFREELIPDLLTQLFHDKGENQYVTESVFRHYFEGINVEDDMQYKVAISELVELIGDTTVNSCHYDLLEKLASNRQTLTFSYLFTHKTPRSPHINARNIQSLRAAGVHHPLFDFGVSHSDELPYLFDPVTVVPGPNIQLTAEDERVSSTMTRIWTEFAKHGNPATALQGYNMTAWRPVRPGNINYYNISSVPAPMGSDYRKGEAVFWLRTVPYIRDLGENIDDLSVYPVLFYVFLGLFILALLLAIILGVLLYKKKTSQKVNL